MKLKIYLLFGHYVIFYNQFHLIHTNPITGVNVRAAGENEFPFLVAITKSHAGPINLKRDMICSATVISTKTVLTSDHCLNDLETVSIHVLVGSNDLLNSQTYFPVWWIAYDQWCGYKQKTIELVANDIALIGFSNDVPSRVIPAEMSFVPLPTLYGNNVVAAGWGLRENYTQTTILQTVDLRAISNNECEVRTTRLSVRPIKLDKRFICTIAEPFALLISGDSGGPLLFEGKIVALTAGTCPTSQPLYHPEKVNIHYGLHYYKEYILESIW